MKVAVLDVDSKIPNLALMKISQYHKQKGDEVEHYLPLAHSMYDKIYASKIFNFSSGSRIISTWNLFSTIFGVLVSKFAFIRNNAIHFIFFIIGFTI